MRLRLANNPDLSRLIELYEYSFEVEVEVMDA